MFANTVGEILFAKDSMVAQVTAFSGEPLIAMLFSVILASTTFVYCAAAIPKNCGESLGASLKPIAGILLIIAGGGAFNAVLVQAHVGDAIVHLTKAIPALPPLVLGWAIAMLLSGSRPDRQRSEWCGRVAGASWR